MGGVNRKWRILLTLYKITVVFLLANFAIGAGIADASVLCLGEDGHRAMESAASCVFCGVRSNHPGQQASIAPGEKLPSGNGCGPCQDYSISSLDVFSGNSMPPPSVSDRDHDGLPLPVCVEGPRFMVPSASSGSGPPELPDPTAIHTRSVVLLI